MNSQILNHPQIDVEHSGEMDRTKIWDDTVHECLDGKVSAIEVVPAIKLHTIDIFMEPRYTETPVHVLQMDTADAAIDLVRKGYRPLLLNMADSKVVGGSDKNFTNEGNLFCRSNYFKSLLQEYYPLKETDVVFSPQICFFKDNEQCNYVDLPAGVFVDCVACPEIQHPGTIESGFETPDDRELLKSKARMIFKTGFIYGHDVLVLSAQNGSAHDIAEVYYELIEEYQGCFRAVIFAILDVDKLFIYQQVFENVDHTKHATEQATEQTEQTREGIKTTEQTREGTGHLAESKLLEESLQEKQGEYKPPVYDPNPPVTNCDTPIPTNVRFG